MQNTGKYRWSICALLFFATTINYMDRQIIGLLKPVLEMEFNWTEKDYSFIVMGFTASYALGLLCFGRLVDKMGSKVGYTLSIVLWSLAAMGHALARNTFGFFVARASLGVGEAGNFPSAIKAVAEWFPKKERALATGIFNSGANIGAIVAPAIIPVIVARFGWQEAFIFTGAIGFVWLLFWWFLFEIPQKHKSLSEQELQHIQQDDDEVEMVVETKKISIKRLLKMPQTWAFAIGKLLTDPVWWFFLFWLPSYFASSFGLDLKKSGLPLIIIYTAASVGSIAGGYMSSYLIKRGWKVDQARKRTMLFIALCVLPIVTAQFTQQLWVIVGLISLASAAHQAWSANIFTTVSDFFPKEAISSVVGIGGMAGAIGGIAFPLLVGSLLDYYKSIGAMNTGYNILFVICGLAYLLAWLVLFVVTPRLSSKKEEVQVLTTSY
ncbi:MFS transporter [Solitalea koreensis]|uniref:MFS transporter, ACS family, hexuronate transporter n=1 Tax=Solitalea koreensis TaxID=543615 RepID=A0A521CKT3_9SPHI|nr:MFS transporter [Solitalea koreensis]SMO60056.1 MFS transporter, ACS family, hexuronate transporter [Solitalea koreensis]